MPCPLRSSISVCRYIYPNATRPANCTFYKDVDFRNPDNYCVGASDAQDCCALCAATAGCNAFSFVNGSTCATPPHTSHSSLSSAHGVASRGGAATPHSCWLKPSAIDSTHSPGVVGGTCGPLPMGPIQIDYLYGDNATAAAALAKTSDVAVVVVATTSHENADRDSLSLPPWQDALVAAVAAVNTRTIVVARCPGACLMPWSASVPSLLFQLMPGQEAGHVLASALFGRVNPSGKLPLSFPLSDTSTWLGNVPNAQWPGIDVGKGYRDVNYTEGLLVGYRWYDAIKTDPLFPFGHGLSYTSFKYSNLTITGSVSATSNVTISVTVTNSGRIAGAEVVQLYIGYPEAAGEPPKSLRDFAKVPLTPGQQTTVTFQLGQQHVSVWDTAANGWQVVGGTFTAFVGSSSRDIRASGTFAVVT